MPAYFSIEFEFKYTDIYDDFVKDIYTTFIQNGFPFKSGFYHENKLTFDDIIIRNQELLRNKLKLGMDQHYLEGYEQILLRYNDEVDLRLFWNYEDKTVSFICIIPEYNVIQYSADEINKFLDLAMKVWKSHTVETVQACLEFDGGYTNSVDIIKGECPVIHPFCIIKKEHYNKISKKLDSNMYEVKDIDNGGVLIKKVGKNG